MRMTSMILSAAVASVLSLGPALAQPEAVPRQAEVPVKQVVLYSSGVGYFEHFGTVSGDASTELRFKTAQINDILKSLVLEDLDGGRVTTITYPSQDPIAKTLKSFQIDITANPPLGELLNQLRGAKVTVALPDQKLTGTILGVESKQVPVGDKAVIERPALNLLVGSSIKSVYVENLQDIALDDPQLQQELTKALTALSQARDQDKKPVNISFAGQGDRRVRVGYVVETPVWKTSYRLILPSGQDKPKLQGWAIVENQTDNDWNNVQLNLVSGRPISFIQDLYQPLYVPRPVVQPELYASLRPQTYEQGETLDGVAEMKDAAESAGSEIRGKALSRRAAGGAGRADAFAAAPAAAAPAQMDAARSVQSVASASKLGELFQYSVGNVSLPRQKSAMLPIVTDEVEIEKVSIYNQAVLPRNPLNGARLKNTTGKHLLQGPITVLEASAYAGDARIDDLPPGQERLLSYGIDLQMLVDPTKNSSSAQLQTGRIVKGVLYITRKHVATQEYAAQNKGDTDKTLFIEHPVKPGWKLVETPAPVETTPALYRFRTPVPAGKSAVLNVKEEIVQDETMVILPADIGQIVFYSRAGEMPEAVREALGKAVQLKQSVVDTDRQINEQAQRLAEITQEQTRIRENMGTVAQQSQYYNRLLTKLNDQESAIEKLQTTRDQLMQQRQQQQKELESYLNELKVG